MGLHANSDQKYIDALLTNNAPLLNELYQNFAGKIKALIITNGGTETDARDIFQEALLAIYKRAKAASFTLNCPLEVFLYVVCKNKWKTELAKRNPGRVTFRDTGSYSTEESSVALTEDLETEQRQTDLFLKKLAALGGNCRRLLQLCWRKKTLQEVAEALQITYGYVRKKKSECMARLITLIKNRSAIRQANCCASWFRRQGYYSGHE